MFKLRFLLFRLLKYYQFLQKLPFWIGYSDTLSKLPAVIYPLCSKKQPLESLLHLSFKSELPINGLQGMMAEAIGPSLVTYILIFHNFSLKGNFLLYLCSKVIGLTCFKLRMLIKNYQPKVQKIFLQCNFVLIVQKLSH